MIVNPRYILDYKIIQGIDYPEEQLQQNGIDITLDKLFRVEGDMILGVARKRMPNFIEILPIYDEIEGCEMFDLEPGQSYVFNAYEYVEIPKDLMATMTTRSTFNRVGVRITSGIWDSGFRGTLGGLITTASIPVRIARDARIAQVVFHKAESASMYNGQYQEGSSQSIGN